MSENRRVGFIGAGQMGLPMVRRLVAGGWDVTAFAATGGNESPMRAGRRLGHR